MTMLVGQKCGMTRVFTADGVSIPVTVIRAEPNRIVQIKNIERDGYSALQVTCGSKRSSRISKPLAGHFAKAAAEPGMGLWEFCLKADGASEYKVGMEFKVDVFKIGDMVDVQGISKGKGFSGVIKRHNFAKQDATHGNSLSHRAPGSIGQRQTPGRVFPGKKMAGHLGNSRCTVQNQQVIRIDLERNLLLIQGGVPGAPGGMVLIKLAVKDKAE